MRSFFAIYCMKLSFVLHNALVLKKLDEQTALNGTVTEALVDIADHIVSMLAGGGKIPVGHRNAGRRMVEELPKRSYEALECIAIRGESSGPNEPVTLGVVRSRVEGKSVRVYVLRVACKQIGRAHV